MDFLQHLLELTDVPLLAAFLLGLLTAFSPCPLATNITAIGFVGREIENRNRVFLYGLCYTLGRTVAYTVLGDALICMVRSGLDTFDLQNGVTRWGEWLVGPVLMVAGLWMLLGDRLPLAKLGWSASARVERLRGAWGSLWLGVLFALAFCPTSGFFFFGMLLPMAAAVPEGYVLPVVYALATGLPVVVVAWMMAYSVQGVARFYRRMQAVQRWLNVAVAVLFLAVGAYYVAMALCWV